jgi:glycosyltransferase involved in cell wall biosynthesis
VGSDELRTLSFLLPGDWNQPTGGYRYDRRIADGLSALGWRVEPLWPSVSAAEAGSGFPWPDAEVKAQVSNALAALPQGRLVLADGLAFGALPALARREAARLRWVALVHHPLALETGLDQREAESLRMSERAALATARRIVTTSRRTLADLAPYDVAPERIAVVEPGTDPAPLAAGTDPDRAWRRALGRSPDPGDGLQLVCVASLTPRKGHAVLLEALSGLRNRAWTLHCVGSAEHDPVTAVALRRSAETAGMGARVLWHGALDEAGVRARLLAADLFVLPSYHEGYGMALAEALACGLPIVSTRAGAIPDTVPADAGVLLPPGDVAAWQSALKRLIDDPSERARLAQGALRARAALPTWEQAAGRMDRALRGVPP